MASLRVLLVERDPTECERISDLLESAQHDVLPLNRLSEAAEALDLQRFDAVLVPSDCGEDELAALAQKLRQLESSSRLDGHVPIVARGAAAAQSTGGPIEAYLAAPFEPLAFSETVGRLAQGAAPAVLQSENSGPIFDASEFAEQVCSDQELMAEIIALYLDESVKQRAEMAELLTSGNLEKLSRLAHTIKGSLSSLHAPRARQRAQELESAGKLGNASACAAAFVALEAELTALAPELVRFRDSLG